MQFTTPNGTLYCADMLELLSTFPPECVDCVVTDPPYRTIAGGNAPSPLHGYAESVLTKNDGRVFKHNDISAREYMPVLYRVLKPQTHAYVMTNVLSLRSTIEAAEAAGFHFSNLLVWKKNNANASRWYMKNTELTLFLHKRPAKPINDCGSKQVFEANNIRGKLHPTQKPVELMAHYILNSTAPGQWVLDPFAGAGATLLAAAQDGRRFVGIEVDPAFYLVACGRLSAGV